MNHIPEQSLRIFTVTQKNPAPNIVRSRVSKKKSPGKPGNWEIQQKMRKGKKMNKKLTQI